MDNRLWQWVMKYTRHERYRLWSIIVLLLVIVSLQSVAAVDRVFVGTARPAVARDQLAKLPFDGLGQRPAPSPAEHFAHFGFERAVKARPGCLRQVERPE